MSSAFLTPSLSERVVPAVGPERAKILIVGEAPGAEEDLAGMPFVGGAGRVLNGMLQEAGIERGECRITNVVNQRPRGNDFAALYEDKARTRPTQVLLDHYARLAGEIRDVAPNLVVALGNEALKALTGKSGITDWRGSVVPGDACGNGVKTLATLHPAAVMRSWGDRPVVVRDLKKAKYEGQFAAILRMPRDFLLYPPMAQVREELQRLRRERRRVAFDIETATGQVNAIAFSDDPQWGMTIPFWFERSGSLYALEEEAEIWELIAALLEDETVPKVAQNAQYDVLFLRGQMGIEVQGLEMDTMVAFHTVYPELPRGLGFLCSIYTDQPYYKDTIHSSRREEFWQYNALDAMVTLEVSRGIEQDAREFGTWEFYLRGPHALLGPVMEMSWRGVRIDREARSEATRTLREEVEERTRALCASVDYAVKCELCKGRGYTGRKRAVRRRGRPGDGAGGGCGEADGPAGPDALVRAGGSGSGSGAVDAGDGTKPCAPCGGTGNVRGINPNSNKQLVEYLYGRLKLPMQKRKRSKGGEYRESAAADEEALRELQKVSDHPCLRLIIEIRERQKVISTYLEAPLSRDGRMRTTFDVAGTETGRLASRSFIDGTGTNLQNIPREGPVKRMFIPDPGMVFVEADLSQAEARVVACLSRDRGLLEVFAAVGGDIHRGTASRLFRKPVEEVTEDERTLAKRCVHALNYGMGPKKFARTLGMEVKAAERLFHQYHATFPGIQCWHRETEARLRRTRVLATPLGRKRHFLGVFTDDLFRAAYAFVPQSTVADHLNAGLVRLAGILRERSEIRAELLLNVHDSVLVQTPAERVEETVALIRECLFRPVEIGGLECVIPVDFKVGSNWGEMRKQK